MAEWIPLLIDGVLAILLVTAIIIFVKVNQRLSAMKAGQDEFTQAAETLAKSVSVAERSVQGIKANAATLQETLGKDIKRAQAMSDELKLITEAADNLASRIERGVTGRPISDSSERAAPTARPRAGSDKASSEIHKEQKALLAALKDAR